MKDWGTEGKINPFNKVCDVSLHLFLECVLCDLHWTTQLIFQITIQFASCSGLSEDKATINWLTKHYLDIEKNTSPVFVLLPWLPSPAKKARQKAMTALYNMLLPYVEIWKKAKTSSMDLEPINFFISQGSPTMIVGVSLPCNHLQSILLFHQIIMNVIFTGVHNAFINCSVILWSS